MESAFMHHCISCNSNLQFSTYAACCTGNILTNVAPLIFLQWFHPLRTNMIIMIVWCDGLIKSSHLYYISILMALWQRVNGVVSNKIACWCDNHTKIHMHSITEKKINNNNNSSNWLSFLLRSIEKWRMKNIWKEPSNSSFCVRFRSFSLLHILCTYQRHRFYYA